MITRIYQLAEELGMSRGELLKLARQIVPSDMDLRTIDLLTDQERLELVAALESMVYEPICA